MRSRSKECCGNFANGHIEQHCVIPVLETEILRFTDALRSEQAHSAALRKELEEAKDQLKAREADVAVLVRAHK